MLGFPWRGRCEPRRPQPLRRSSSSQVFPGPAGLNRLVYTGNPTFKPEELISYQAGYRVRLRRAVSLDLTAFYNDYDNIETTIPGMPFADPSFPAAPIIIPLVPLNGRTGRARGAEAATTWRLRESSQLYLSYSWLDFKLRSSLAGVSDDVRAAEDLAPNHQFHARWYHDLPGGLQWDNSYYFVTSLGRSAFPPITGSTPASAGAPQSTSSSHSASKTPSTISTPRPPWMGSNQAKSAEASTARSAMISSPTSWQAVPFLRWTACFCSLWILAIPILMAQSASATFTEYQVKAVFIYNFAKFVEWPPRDTKGTLKIGILGDDPFGDYLDEVIRDKTIRSRPIETRHFHTVDNLEVCDILFISESESKRTLDVIKILAGVPVLTVGEGRGFAEQGGMIGLVIDDGKVRFDINTKAAKASGITVRSQLLDLARSVKQ